VIQINKEWIPTSENFFDVAGPANFQAIDNGKCIVELSLSCTSAEFHKLCHLLTLAARSGRQEVAELVRRNSANLIPEHLL